VGRQVLKRRIEGIISEDVARRLKVEC